MDQASRLRLAEVIKQARGNLSQHQFAEQLEISQSTIQRWEKGQGTISLDKLEKLAAYCQQTPEAFAAYIYGRELQPRSLAEIVDGLSPQMLSMIVQATSQRLQELTADDSKGGDLT